MDNTTYMLLALVFFVEVAVLVLQHQNYSDRLQKKTRIVETLKKRLGEKIEVLDQENDILSQQLDDLKNEVEACRG
jgi:cell division protein FtsB